jgi:hypothetical protein
MFWNRFCTSISCLAEKVKAGSESGFARSLSSKERYKPIDLYYFIISKISIPIIAPFNLL